jgi:Rieske Fe-S protein
MAHKPGICRRDCIKTVTAFIGNYRHRDCTAFHFLSTFTIARENGRQSLIDFGPLEKYPIGIPTWFEFTHTQVNGWERTAINYGLFVVRKSEDEIRVFSDICTHLGCRVTWHPDQEHYISPCHDGHFDITGNVVSGPPPRPLDEFIAEIKNGNLLVSLPPVKRAR